MRVGETSTFDRKRSLMFRDIFEAKKAFLYSCSESLELKRSLQNCIYISKPVCKGERFLMAETHLVFNSRYLYSLRMCLRDFSVGWDTFHKDESCLWIESYLLAPEIPICDVCRMTEVEVSPKFNRYLWTLSNGSVIDLPSIH